MELPIIVVVLHKHAAVGGTAVQVLEITVRGDENFPKGRRKEIVDSPGIVKGHGSFNDIRNTVLDATGRIKVGGIVRTCENNACGEDTCGKNSDGDKDKLFHN